MCKTPFIRELRPDKRVLPYSKSARMSATPIGCGQCIHCKINKSRIWMHRILLERMCHNSSVFVTLTYNDENLPIDGQVDKRVLQLFIKRLRRRYDPLKLRYFGVGEYGAKTFRPHYHIILFNFDIMQQELIKDSWKNEDGEDMGFISVYILSKYLARYITGYIIKGLKDMNSDYVRDNYRMIYGCTKEFMISSKKNGGIGFKAIEKMAKEIKKTPYFDVRVIKELKYGKKLKLPLGRYLTEKLSKEIGVSENLIAETLKSYQEGLFNDYLNSDSFTDNNYLFNIIDSKEDKRQSQIAKNRIYKQKRNI